MLKGPLVVWQHIKWTSPPLGGVTTHLGPSSGFKMSSEMSEILMTGQDLSAIFFNVVDSATSSSDISWLPCIQKRTRQMTINQTIHCSRWSECLKFRWPLPSIGRCLPEELGSTATILRSVFLSIHPSNKAPW